MGRKSIAEKMYQRHEYKEKGESTWLMVYDLQSSGTTEHEGRYAAVDLVIHYRGDVMLFKVELVTT